MQRASLLVTAILALAATRCGQPPTPNPLPLEEGLTVEAIGPRGDVVSIGAEGGTAQAELNGVTYRLVIPAGALAENVDIALTPARVQEVAVTRAVIFEPDGLVFAVPALLTITPAATLQPLVGLSIDDAGVVTESGLALVTGADVTMAIPHFSSAAILSGEDAVPFVPAEVAALIELARSSDDGTKTALAIGDLFRHAVAPAVDGAVNSAPSFLRAAATFQSWIGLLSNATFATDEPHTVGNPQTVAQLQEETELRLITIGRNVLARITQPACSDAAGDVGPPRSWVAVPTRVANALSDLGSAQTFTPCASYALRIRGTTEMASDTAEVRTTTTLELVAPGDRREAVPAEFSFALVGAAGDETVQGPGGEVSVTFTRALGDERPRVVVVTASAVTSDSELGAILPPAPVELRAVESGTSATMTSTPARIERASDTAQVCTTATFDGAPATNIAVITDVTVGTLTTARPGIEQPCGTFTPPRPLPAGGGVARVDGVVRLDNGDRLPVTTTIELAPGNLTFTFDAPTTSAGPGVSVPVCGTATSDGVPVPSYEVTFSLAGVGQLSALTTSVRTSDGRVCVDYVAPDPYVVATTTLTAVATAAGLSATDASAVELAELGVVVELSPETARIGDVVAVCANVFDESGGVEGAELTFASGAGTFSTPATTDADGTACADLTTTTLGRAAIDVTARREESTGAARGSVLVRGLLPGTYLGTESSSDVQTITGPTGSSSYTARFDVVMAFEIADDLTMQVLSVDGTGTETTSGSACTGGTWTSTVTVEGIALVNGDVVIDFGVTERVGPPEDACLPAQSSVQRVLTEVENETVPRFVRDLVETTTETRNGFTLNRVQNKHDDYVQQP